MKKESPAEILKEVVIENDSFVSSRGKEYFENHIHSQNPQITLITCSDARVQPSIFSEEMIDKVFVIRNIGNQLENNTGSVDYGIFHLKTPLLLILGHVHCGAIKAFLEGYENESRSIRNELDHLCIPMKKACGDNFEDQWLKAVEENVHWQVKLAMERYEALVKKDLLAIVGAVYDFANYYGKGYGRIKLINVNGERSPDKIKKLKVTSLIPESITELIV